MPIPVGATGDSPATVDDIEARWRPLTAQETTNAATFLSDAWTMLRERLPLLEGNIADGKVSEASVIRVLSAMVLRVLRNPNGYDSETVDDYTYRRNAIMASGMLAVTADELADLTPGRKRRSSVRLVSYGDS